MPEADAPLRPQAFDCVQSDINRAAVGAILGSCYVAIAGFYVAMYVAGCLRERRQAQSASFAPEDDVPLLGGSAQ